MKNSLRITLAVVLIVLGVLSYGCKRPRPLTECFPEGPWEHISCRERELKVDPQQLQKAMEGIMVFRTGNFDGFDCNNFSVQIRIGGVRYLAQIGEDGHIAIACSDDLEKSRTCWLDLDGELFRLLTGQKEAAQTAANEWVYSAKTGSI